MQELIDTIKNINLNSEDGLVSFDVKALFLSIPVDKTMKSSENWLNCTGIKKRRFRIMLN